MMILLTWKPPVCLLLSQPLAPESCRKYWAVRVQTRIIIVLPICSLHIRFSCKFCFQIVSTIAL
jgi:hypothetical protein